MQNGHNVIPCSIPDNIESDLQNQSLDYSTIRELCKGIETNFSSKLATIRKEIDQRLPNPMLCSEDNYLQPYHSTNPPLSISSRN